jgi:hypothetical protein
VGRVQRNLSIGSGQTVSLAIMEFRSGERLITRWVADQPSRTRDVTDDHGMSSPDPDIFAEFQPGSVVMLIGGPGPADLHVVLNQPEHRTRIKIGEPFELGDRSVTDRSLLLTATHLYQNARFDRRPTVTPRRQRRGDVNSEPIASRIKVLLQIPDKNWSQELWLDYHRYPRASAQYAVQGRFRYNPTVITLPNGRRIELMFSRQRAPLPNAVTLEDFELLTHAGGYIPNQTTTVRDFVSRLRAYRDGAWSDTFTTSLNNPASDSGKYYFQSEWDPGEMAYTVLGVGNRNGVYIQLAGTCIAVAGMIFVFYIKPIIKRRRRSAVWSAVAEERGQAAVPQPDNV